MKHCHFNFSLQAMQSLCMSLVYYLVYPRHVDKCGQQKSLQNIWTCKDTKSAGQTCCGHNDVQTLVPKSSSHEGR